VAAGTDETPAWIKAIYEQGSAAKDRQKREAAAARQREADRKAAEANKPMLEMLSFAERQLARAQHGLAPEDDWQEQLDRLSAAALGPNTGPRWPNGQKRGLR
jgi:hypothetical protein